MSEWTTLRLGYVEELEAEVAELRDLRVLLLEAYDQLEQAGSSRPIACVFSLSRPIACVFSLDLKL